jgi:probable addiction module antidote protein
LKTKTKAFDTASYLETDEDIAAYMTEALASGEAAVVAHALGTVARARGMSRVAHDTGLSRESLYRALSADGNPELATVLRIIQAIGLRLTAEAARKAA